ncbi:MAG: META domain-containing protein [Chloroflexota bacterium]|jgi:heat shock protein HslJ
MKKILAAGLFVVLALNACAGGSDSPSLEGQWRLVSYGSASAQIPAAPDVETSIEFKDGQMSGNVGCNGFGGEYTVDGDTITFGPIMSTMMFCEAVAVQESSTLAVFQEKASFVLEGDTLTIKSTDGAMSIVLARK